MQFMKSKKPVMTCPQCDNVVRIDADVCDICGQQLKGLVRKQLSPVVQQARTASAPLNQIQTEEEYEDDEEEYEDDEEYEEDGEQATANSASPTLPSVPGELLNRLQQLQEQASQIERYFPADLPAKDIRLTLWKKQLQRAYSCAELFEHPQIQQVESHLTLKLYHHLAEATRALDFTRQYSVKVIGHAGAGKSTLLAAMIGQDIFPRMAGGAVTGVRTKIRLCNAHEEEELHVHFMTRDAFDDLLKQTQQAIQQASNARMREAFSEELAILMKASETFGELYLKDDEPHVEIIPREHWNEESSRYIEEPARDSDKPRIIRLIDFVEYRVRTNSSSLLPPKSVLVDLPGGEAGRVRHDAILREELNEVDAVILVIGNNRFGDDERTQRIFELVKRKITQGRAPDVAGNMLFLAVTHWDEINSAASLEKALGSLRPLLRDLPTGYNSHHHHGPTNDYFFYPVRAVDALLATLGMTKQTLDAERTQEGRDYAGRILSAYPDLLKIDTTLPAVAHAQEFQKVTLKQHEAMLNLSGLPNLVNDLQTFLTNNRYEVQLRQAETQLAMAFQHLEDLCWENLNNLGIHSRDLQELQSEMQARKNKRGALRFEQLQSRTNEMHMAWGGALKEFDAVMSSANNPFHYALVTAHERAVRRINLRIMQGQFDHFIKVSGQSQAASPAMEIGTRWIDIDGWGLIKELRLGFTAALERELNEPARTLAEVFLIPITHKEEIDGTLDINRIALGEFGGELDEIHKTYHKLKRGIRDKSRDVCFYVTMGELLNEEKYAPSKETPAVNALYRLATQQEKAEELIQQARALMGPILEVICARLAQSTERRIIHLFRYELDKLETKQIYDNDHLDILPVSVYGGFADLVNRLYSQLTERIITSEVLRQQLDALQASRDAIVDHWVDTLHKTEMLRTIHRQN